MHPCQEERSATALSLGSSTGCRTEPMHVIFAYPAGGTHSDISRLVANALVTAPTCAPRIVAVRGSETIHLLEVRMFERPAADAGLRPVRLAGAGLLADAVPAP